MIVTHDVKLMSSFMLFLDHVVMEKGRAFTNYSGSLYRVNSPYQGLYAYASPFKHLGYDASISNMNVMSGIYLNNTLVGIGTSGLHSINYNEGTAYFSSAIANGTSISGRYSVKDFGIKITDQPESKLLLETKYVLNSKYNQTLSGLPLDVTTAPIIFLKYKTSENKPFAFGGIDDNSIKIRAIAVCDNEFQKIALGNIFKNLNWSGFNLLNSTPLDWRGSYTGSVYNYNTLSYDSTYVPFVREVRVFDVPAVGEYENLPRFALLADFEIFCAMRHNT
jgi:hypothetical protein